MIAGEALTLLCSIASHDMPDERGEHYRRRGNRALRDGDVVAIDGRFYLSTSFGWDPVLSPNLVGTGRPDSIPLRGVPEAT